MSRTFVRPYFFPGTANVFPICPEATLTFFEAMIVCQFFFLFSLFLSLSIPFFNFVYAFPSFFRLIFPGLVRKS